ncbi:MAG: hypothetical protein ACO3DT_04535 [Gammaproteobacteria bacterium]|jgi:hypothetical protein|nr:hypothetical protein [Gammaproteobacteria bacterium]
MKTNNIPDIKRLEDGSIDYAYYAASGSMARHNEIKSLMTSIPRLIPGPGSLAPLIGLVVIIPFLVW